MGTIRATQRYVAQEVAKKPEGHDVALVHGATDDGGYEIVRFRPDRLEAGVVRPLEHGKPIAGEVVRLSPRDGSRVLYDVEVQCAARVPADRGGPAQVATASYRDGWEAVWGKKDLN